ncbi:MAG: hypothetical protein ABJ205_12115 [Erythrobacter sp.]|uniref:hypothetical protein n=1 Tax=Erythrobacter sp. TaxID=1042 RepID=UPI003263B291
MLKLGSCSEAAQTVELGGAAINGVSQCVRDGVVGDGLFNVGLGRDEGFAAALGDRLPGLVSVLTAVLTISWTCPASRPFR